MFESPYFYALRYVIPVRSLLYGNSIYVRNLKLEAISQLYFASWITNLHPTAQRRRRRRIPIRIRLRRARRLLKMVSMNTKLVRISLRVVFRVGFR